MEEHKDQQNDHDEHELKGAESKDSEAKDSGKPWEKEHDDFEADFDEEGASASGPRLSFKSVYSAFCEAERQVEDVFMSAVPPEVTRHLINSQKELVKAGMRLGEIAMEELERRASRAEDLHEEMKQRKQQGTAEEPADPAPHVARPSEA